MSAEASTEDGFGDLTPTEIAAARGELPEWARALDLGEAEALRWAATGWLHDVLRDADPPELLHLLDHDERSLPGRIMHGPAAAARLKGLVPPRVATAIRYHTLGHPSLDDMGRCLYLADFLEPGRDFDVDWRAGLRARMPRERAAVLVEVIGARMRHLIDDRKPIRPETAAFWSHALDSAR